ncbi:hypothetical protein [Vineibacter terrae]|uniref:hypothetical protein n=1 Tax=Vineibacter terrae TaxID=2586908 RepID=UPI002E36B328|nr:hypothetical protein [Vineibacter terrae]HEX2884892.1 hypothetical protein [Vineibacter terrae]
MTDATPVPMPGKLVHVDDSKVQEHINWAWSNYWRWPYAFSDSYLKSLRGVFLKRLYAEFRLLQWERRKPGRSADVNLAAAEHYLFARQAVATAQVSAFQMRQMVRGYEVTKAILETFGLEGLMRTTSEPTAPSSPDHVRWGLKGVDDGERDRLTHNGGASPPVFSRSMYKYGSGYGYY